MGLGPSSGMLACWEFGPGLFPFSVACTLVWTQPEEPLGSQSSSWALWEFWGEEGQGQGVQGPQPTLAPGVFRDLRAPGAPTLLLQPGFGGVSKSTGSIV